MIEFKLVNKIYHMGDETIKAVQYPMKHLQLFLGRQAQESLQHLTCLAEWIQLHQAKFCLMVKK